MKMEQICLLKHFCRYTSVQIDFFHPNAKKNDVLENHPYLFDKLLAVVKN